MKREELEKKVDSLEAFTADGFTRIEEFLEKLVARAEALSVVKEELSILREEKRDLLDRLMARDWETYATLKQPVDAERVSEEAKDIEMEEMAGEVFTPSEEKKN